MWQKAWNPKIQSFKDDGWAKVLRKMKVPDNLKKECIKPLLICWTPIAPENEPDSFLFQVATRPSPDCHFSEVWVFLHIQLLA